MKCQLVLTPSIYYCIIIIIIWCPIVDVNSEDMRRINNQMPTAHRLTIALVILFAVSYVIIWYYMILYGFDFAKAQQQHQ